MWAHNTIVSSGNPPDPNNPDTSTFTNTANDFALYNVLGGVAAGRYISTSTENGTFTGIQTPNGKLGFGTGFLIAGLNSGNAVFKPSMSSATDNGGEEQSYRGILANTNAHEITKNLGSTPNTTPETLTFPGKSRIWVNIEKGMPPTPPTINYNQLKQLLVGYTNGATTADNDRVYDAETVTVQPLIEFYSLAPAFTGSTKHLAIQGRDDEDFTGTDYFQLGYRVTDSGDYTFTAVADGIFSPGQKHYFIWDNGIPHDFPYTAHNLVGGVVDETRFRITFGERHLAFKLNIEGYYDTSVNLMRTVRVNQGTSTDLNLTDLIDVELRNQSTYAIEYQESGLTLSTTGNATITDPSMPLGTYYLVVKHRNAVKTWSAIPITTANNQIYDFTSAASQAYGSNQIEVEPGVFAFYSGDINQDESVDNSDSDLLFDDINNSNFGDLATDLNGDGSVDNSELDFFIPNSINSIYSMHP